MIFHAVRWEGKFYFGLGIIDNAAKARIQEKGFPPIQLWNEVNWAQVGDSLCDFDILFVRCIVRVIDVDVIVTFRKIDGEVATEQEASATIAFDEDGYSLDNFVLSVENLPLNYIFVSFSLIHRAFFILLEIYISHIYSSFLLVTS